VRDCGVARPDGGALRCGVASGVGDGPSWRRRLGVKGGTGVEESETMSVVSVTSEAARLMRMIVLEFFVSILPSIVPEVERRRSVEVADREYEKTNGR
jgi:hypothetical protein